MTNRRKREQENNDDNEQPILEKGKMINDLDGDDHENNDHHHNNAAPTTDPITIDGERPQKKFYRQRAHCNPLAHNDTFIYPYRPIDMNWISNEHYPKTALLAAAIASQPSIIQPTVLDIGCGFGGLTLSLAYLLPNEYILGMEIRAKVTEYVRLRIANARKEYINHCSKNTQHDNEEITDQAKNSDVVSNSTINDATKMYSNSKTEHIHNHHHYNNCSVLRTNSMKFLPHYFAAHTISKIFICFPDPHFKRKNHARRIITVRLLSIYAYILQQGLGKLYFITDVKELHDWHIAACTEHPLFQVVTVGSTDNNNNDENGVSRTTTADVVLNNNNDDTKEEAHTTLDQQLIDAMKTETEEGKKVTRNGGMKYYAIYRRIYDYEDTNEINSSNFFSR